MMTLLVIHFAATWALVGLIWMVQVVHYPLFNEVGPDRFVAYHQRHMSLVTWVVGPLMLVELGTAAGLFYLGERSLLFVISLAALVLNWVSTALVQVPLHRKLTGGHDTRMIRQLVRSNGWRTAGWTVRGLCLAGLLLSRIT
jgi:hypothetical protein